MSTTNNWFQIKRKSGAKYAELSSRILLIIKQETKFHDF